MDREQALTILRDIDDTLNRLAQDETKRSQVQPFREERNAIVRSWKEGKSVETICSQLFDLITTIDDTFGTLTPQQM